MPLSQIEQLMHLTARIEATMTDSSVSRGTGFFFNFCTQPDGRYVPALVTNKHVIDGSVHGVIHFSMSENGEVIPGGHIPGQFPNFGNMWLRHPSPDVDLAVLPLNQVQERFSGQPRQPFWVPFHMQYVPNQEFLDELGPIEDILMIGYPIGLWDSVNNAPIFRRGITATHPRLNLNGKSEFMIDCACFPGSSGSPVLLANIGSYTDKNFNVHLGSTRLHLLGILWGGPQHTAQGEVRAVPVPTATRIVAESSIPSNLGYCIKSSELRWFDGEIGRRVGLST